MGFLLRGWARVGGYYEFLCKGDVLLVKIPSSSDQVIRKVHVIRTCPNWVGQEFLKFMSKFKSFASKLGDQKPNKLSNFRGFDQRLTSICENNF